MGAAVSSSMGTEDVAGFLASAGGWLLAGFLAVAWIRSSMSLNMGKAQAPSAAMVGNPEGEAGTVALRILHHHASRELVA